MNLNTRSLFIAAGIGAALQIVMALATQLFQFAVLQSSVADTSLAVRGLAEYSAIVTALACVCGAAGDLLAGGAYALSHPRAEFMVGDGALGGAAAGALARLVSGSVGMGISLLLLPLTYQRIQGLMGGPAPDAGIDPMLTFSMVGGLITGVLGILAAMAAGAVLGAISGGVATALRTRSGS